MRPSAVVVAAGRGRRFDREGPRKQYREVDGRAVAELACRPFVAEPRIGSVVLVLPPADLEDPPAWARTLPVRVAGGGDTRRASVRRGLEALEGKGGAVLVHDGARPLVTGAVIDRVLDAVGEGPVVPTIPIPDTVKEVDGAGRVVATLDRSRLRRVQTPQGFPLELLLRAHREVDEEAEATDDAGLCERLGVEVRTVPGDEENLKITTAEDLDRARRLLADREARDG